MDEETREFHDVLARGVEIFNRGEYFEAHDVWEEHWLNTHGSDRCFLQGLIQTAAALYKLEMGNVAGMSKLLSDAVEALGKVTGNEYGIDLPALRMAVGSWKKRADEMIQKKTADADAADFPRLVYRPPGS